MIGTVKTYHGPIYSTVTATKNNEALTHDSAVIEPTAVEKPDLRALLAELGTQEKQQLIAELFSEDIETIVKTESERGYKKGLEQGLADAQSKSQLANQKVLQELDSQRQTLERLLESINELTPQVQLADDDVFEIITTAVFKLLGERLDKGDYLEQILQRAIEECLVSKQVVLCLSPEDYQFVQTHLIGTLSSSEQEQLKIKQDKCLAIGDSKLELVNGSIETSFSEKLQSWCKNLTQLKRSASVG